MGDTPNFFNCARWRRENSSVPRSGVRAGRGFTPVHDTRPTGRMKRRRPTGRRGQRTSDWQYEYHCRTCGHTGWTTHVEFERAVAQRYPCSWCGGSGEGARGYPSARAARARCGHCFGTGVQFPPCAVQDCGEMASSHATEGGYTVPHPAAPDGHRYRPGELVRSR